MGNRAGTLALATFLVGLALAARAGGADDGSEETTTAPSYKPDLPTGNPGAAQGGAGVSDAGKAAASGSGTGIGAGLEQGAKVIVNAPVTPPPSGARVMPPPSSDELQEIDHDVNTLVRAGHREEAREVLAAAAELHPGDATLAAMQKLIGQEDLQGTAQMKVADAEEKILATLNIHKRGDHLVQLVKDLSALRPQGGDSSPELASMIQMGAGASAAGKAPVLEPAMAARLEATAAARSAVGWVNDLNRKTAVGDNAGALAMLDEQLRHDPKDALAMTRRAGVLLAMRRYPEAEMQARDAIAAGEAAQPREMLASALNAQGKPAAALIQANRAVALDPHDAFAWYARSDAHFRLGELESGLSDLEKAAALDPSVFADAYKDTIKAVEQSPSRSAPDALLVFSGVLIVGSSALIGFHLWRRLRERCTPTFDEDE